jgi:hypothetical protein|tara:strand:- start:292 stop:573 length:282 start_codon:yes stop_codon:yes gene_type:complete
MTASNTKKEAVEPLDIRGSNMFGTFDSVESLVDSFDNYSPSDRWLLSLAHALTINTIVNIMVKYCDGKAVAEPIPPLFRIRDNTKKTNTKKEV